MGAPLPPERAADVGAGVPAAALTPVEAARTVASSAEAFALSGPKRRGRRLAIWGGVAIAAVAGFWLKSQGRRPPHVAVPVTSAPAGGPAPGAVAGPVVEPMPPAPAPAAAADDDGEPDEPAAKADDTDVAPPKVDKPDKPGRVRRRPARRAAAAKHTATSAAPSTPVKRKLINEL